VVKRLDGVELELELDLELGPGPGLDLGFGHDSQLYKVCDDSQWLALWCPTKGELEFELLLKNSKKYQKLLEALG
jgi:hypothetical protein